MTAPDACIQKEFVRRIAQWFCRNDHLLVIPIVLLLVFPSPWMWAGLLLALLPIGCRSLATGQPLPTTRANLPLLVLLIMTLVGFLLSPARDLAVITVAQLVAGVTLFSVLSSHLQSSEDLWGPAKVLAVLGTVLALGAPMVVMWSGEKLFEFPQFYELPWPRLGIVTNSNIMAGAIAVTVPFALVLIMQPIQGWRALGTIALCADIAMLILLQSRGALVGTALGLALQAVLFRRWFLPLLPAILLGLLVVDYGLGGPSPAEFAYGREATAGAETLPKRERIWAQGLYLIRQSPVIGIGLGAYARLSPVAWPNSPDAPGQAFPHAHNLWLQVALDTGLVGAGAFLTLLALAVRSAWNGYRAQIARPLAAAVLAGFAVLLTHTLVDTIFWGAKPSVLLWLLLGLAYQFDTLKDRLYNSKQSAWASRRLRFQIQGRVNVVWNCVAIWHSFGSGSG